jgi:hypothetical protein
MSWWPKGALHEDRKLHMYADWEITACLAFADEKIAAQPDDTPERRRLVAWKSGFEAEKVDRIAVREAFGRDQKGALAIVSGGSSPTGEDDPTPPQTASPGGSQ